MSIKGFEVGGVQAKYDYESLDNIPANLVQDANYVHTDNNYTNADKTKLSGIEAQANKTTIDATLTHSGQAADAKATGDAISALNAQVIASMPHDTASGSIASFPDGAAMPVRDLSVDIEPIQAGSGDPSPDNVRPISGWTEAKVTRTGENIAPSDKWQVGTLTNSGQTTTVPYAQRTLFLPCEPNTSYILKISEEKNIRLFGYETNQSNPQATTFGTAVLGKEASIITGANDVFIRACVWDTDTSVTLNFSDFSPVVLAKDVQVYTIPIGQTVYGGTLDVTSGKLTVDRAMQDLGALSYTYTDGSAQFRSTTALDNVLSPVDSNADVHAISSLYRVGKYADLASNDFYLTIVFQGSFAAGQVWLKNSNYSDPNVFKTAMSGVQLCYELATPIEVDLTPTEITTLLGTNNIFADCGDTTVNYYADTTLFVNKKIAAAVAALS